MAAEVAAASAAAAAVAGTAENTNFDFVATRMVGFVISMAMVLATLVGLNTIGLNFGTDFKGGILIEARAPHAVDVSALRAKLDGLGLGNIELQEFGTDRDVLIRVERQDGGEGLALRLSQHDHARLWRLCRHIRFGCRPPPNPHLPP
jgi:preprotein translocase subunit SecF